MNKELKYKEIKSNLERLRDEGSLIDGLIIDKVGVVVDSEKFIDTTISMIDRMLKSKVKKRRILIPFNRLKMYNLKLINEIKIQKKE